MSILKYGILSQSTLAPIPSLEISPTTYEPTTAGGTEEITVSSNVGWSVAERSAYSWINLDVPSEPSGDDTFDIMVSANTGSARTGYIDVSSYGLTTKTVTVSQSACVAPIAGITVCKDDSGDWSFTLSSASISLGSKTLSYSFRPTGLSATNVTVYMNVFGSQTAFKEATARDGVTTSGSFTLPNNAACGDYYTITVCSALPM